MPFIKELNKDFFIKDNHFELSPEYIKANKWKFKKLTGSKFSSVVIKGKFNSPVKTWCQMVGIYTEPMDKMTSDLGIYIEPKIRAYVTEKLGIKFKDYVPSEVKWDVFKDAHKILGGIPDGEPIDENGNLDYSDNKPMLEIKTSSIDKLKRDKEKGVYVLRVDDKGVPIVKEKGAKMLDWIDNNGHLKVSNDYQCQLGLYLYLRGQTNGMFAVCFLKPEDYVNPKAVDVHDRKIMMARIKYDPAWMQKLVDIAIAWYHEYIDTGISPELTEDDKTWLKEVELLK